MTFFALIIAILSAVVAERLPPPRAPFNKHIGPFTLRDDVIALSGGGTNNARYQSRDAIHPLQVSPRPITLSSIHSTAPQQFHPVTPVAGIHFSAKQPKFYRRSSSAQENSEIIGKQIKPQSLWHRSSSGKTQEASFSHQTPLAEIKYFKNPPEINSNVTPLDKIEQQPQRKQRQHYTATGSKGSSDDEKKDVGEDGRHKYHHYGNEKESRGTSKQYHETRDHGDSIKEDKKKKYEDNSGHKKSYEDGSESESETSSQSESSQKGFSENHAEHDKGKYAEGYHNLHHTDEKKMHDSFYNNGDEEETWTHYGHNHHKGGKEAFKQKGGKWYKEEMEKDSQKKEKEEKAENGSSSAKSHEKTDSEGKNYKNNVTFKSVSKRPTIASL